MEQQDQIELTCPVCGKAHAYPIAVDRSMAIGLLTPDTMTDRVRTFVRLFTCPTNGAQFQATLRLRETALDKIESVNIGDAV